MLPNKVPIIPKIILRYCMTISMLIVKLSAIIKMESLWWNLKRLISLILRVELNNLSTRFHQRKNMFHMHSSQDHSCIHKIKVHPIVQANKLLYKWVTLHNNRKSCQILKEEVQESCHLSLRLITTTLIFIRLSATSS